MQDNRAFGWNEMKFSSSDAIVNKMKCIIWSDNSDTIIYFFDRIHAHAILLLKLALFSVPIIQIEIDDFILAA